MRGWAGQRTDRHAPWTEHRLGLIAIAPAVTARAFHATIGEMVASKLRGQIPRDMATKHIPSDFRLIVFDLDGTLIDSKDDLALSVNLMRAEMGLAPLEYELIASYVGQGVGVLVRRVLGNGKPETVPDVDAERGVEIFLRTYRLHMLDHTVTYDGVREALAALVDRQSSESPKSVTPGKTVPRSLAVLTNKPVNFSRAILVGLGIAPYFAFVYGGNSPELNQQKKPHPVGVLKLMGETGATADQTLIVGDSDTDVLTGRNAGVWTCGVTYGIGSHTLVTTPPDVLLDDLRELPPLLGLGNRNGKST
jgi:phosphoglycolate phosphatase